MSFELYMKESMNNYKSIMDILNELDSNEMDYLGYTLYVGFFKDENNHQDISDEFFTIDDVVEMISELGENFYPYILDMLSFIEDSDTDRPVTHLQSPAMDGRNNVDKYDGEEESDSYDMGDMGENVSRMMQIRSMNKKKRKFMANSAADLRRTAAQRRKENRMTRSSRRRYYNANKQKIANYQKSRKSAIEKGKHIVKLRRRT